MAYQAGDILVQVTGTISSVEEFSNTWAFKNAGEGSLDEQELVDLLHDFYDYLATGSPNVWSDKIQIVDARCHGLFSNEEIPVNWALITGTGTNKLLPSECACRISLKATGSRGGCFLPSFGVQSIDVDGQLLGPYQTLVRDGLSTLIDAAAAGGGPMGLHSPTTSTVKDLTGAKVGETFDVIRRRRNTMPENYLAVVMP